MTHNIASYRQRLFGECPIGDDWLCFEQEANQKNPTDLVKEKEVTIAEEPRDGLEMTSGTNMFIDLIERISKELGVTNCWVCGNTQMSEVWPWEGISLNPIEILKWEQSKQKPQVTMPREKEQ